MTVDKARRILASCQSGKFDEPIGASDLEGLAQAYIDHLTAIGALEATIKQLEVDNREACRRLADAEAMIGRVEKAAGL